MTKMTYQELKQLEIDDPIIGVVIRARQTYVDAIAMSFAPSGWTAGFRISRKPWMPLIDSLPKVKP